MLVSPYDIVVLGDNMNNINNIATLLSCGDMTLEHFNQLFVKLYNLLKPKYEVFLYNYKSRHDLLGSGIDDHMFESAFNVAILDSIEDYDMDKGEFLPRLWYFTNRRFTNVLSYHLAKKRSAEYVELDDSVGSVEDEYFKVEESPTFKKIQEFIAKDKYGEVINILIRHSGRLERSNCFLEYFGQYDARERKIVQRTRERLKNYLEE